jgi:hypothetical protein
MNRAFVLAVMLLGGCGPSIVYMHPVEPPQPLAAPPNTGLVVFVRPSGYGGAAPADILDEAGRWMGRTSGMASFAVATPPGHHMFVVWGENTDAVDVDVQPGHIYFVEVAITMGWASAQFHLYAISPRTPSWPKRDEWMAKSRQMQPDMQAGSTILAGRENDVQERLRRAREHLAKYQGTPEEVRHFMLANDGI